VTTGGAGPGATGPRTRRANIKDVATEAGVSLTTVSHVLNEKGRVDAATRERVLEAARRLEYLPSRAARGLVSGRTFTLGLALPQIGQLPLKDVLSSEWYAKVTVLASQRAIERDYAVAVLPPFSSYADLARFSVDGVLVLDPVVDDPRLTVLADSGVPHVSVGHDPGHPDVPSVVPDATGGARSLFGHLVERGRRRILVLAGPASWEYVEVVMASARQVCDPAGVQLELQVIGDERTQDRESLSAAVRDVTRTALTGEARPDAVVGLFEGFGAMILLVATSLGLAVPEDVSVAQDLDDAFAKTVSPSITALDQHLDLQAAAGIDLLLARLEGEGEVANVTTPISLVLREST
jgi:DNA-binding LacI/PurR family transcriptional regulator